MRVIAKLDIKNDYELKVALPCLSCARNFVPLFSSSPQPSLPTQNYFKFRDHVNILLQR